MFSLRRINAEIDACTRELGVLLDNDDSPSPKPPRKRPVARMIDPPLPLFYDGFKEVILKTFTEILAEHDIKYGLQWKEKEDQTGAYSLLFTNAPATNPIMEFDVSRHIGDYNVRINLFAHNAADLKMLSSVTGAFDRTNRVYSRCGEGIFIQFTCPALGGVGSAYIHDKDSNTKDAQNTVQLFCGVRDYDATPPVHQSVEYAGGVIHGFDMFLKRYLKKTH